MKDATRTKTLVAFLAFMTYWPIGCGKAPDKLDKNWTPAVGIATSIGGLGGAIRLHRHKDTLIGVQVLHGGLEQLFILNGAKDSWSELAVGNVPSGYLWGFAAIDPQGKKILLPEGYSENEQLVMKCLIGTITENVGLRDISEKLWLTDKKTLLGDTRQNVRLNEPGSRNGAGLGPGLLDGAKMYIPVSLYAETTFGINNVSNGPFANGVFCSNDAGITFRFEGISDWEGGAPALCKTGGHVYYFAGISPLWFSRKSSEMERWEKPQTITETFSIVNGSFDVAGDKETAHVCWMDRRHNKMRFNLTGPPIENNDIYYRRRKDSDADWGNEVHLSKGLLYCYAPTISAESDNVVVVWAGIKTADKQHTDMGPNDVYYVKSKDGGKTWTSPLRVTDGAKDGITAGMPQVALLNGTIHLLYIQGAQRQPAELSPGLAKLGQGSWPIYYQQCPFQN